MGKIEILSDNLINKIAAGEVVNRPFSVVKELVENALDAKSTKITIILENGGKSHIQVMDNGIGMDEDNLLLAFERHATSKIKSFDDLESIETMGFRGEALPSIAAVSKVSATSKPVGTSEGKSLLIEGGLVKKIIPAPISCSTDIKIKSLFYNIPARRKFLKDDKTEYRYIYSYLKKVFISHYEISFKLIHNDRIIFDLKGSTLEERIRAIYPEVERENLLFINLADGEYAVSGFVGKKELSRKNKDNQLLFVNHRIVENRMISYSVFQGLKNLLEPGYYPFFILFLNIPAGKVDVNVHPSKMEVKFHDEHYIRRLVTKAISQDILGQFSLYNYTDDESEKLVSGDTNNPAQISLKEEEATQINFFEKKETAKNLNLEELAEATEEDLDNNLYNYNLNHQPLNDLAEAEEIYNQGAREIYNSPKKIEKFFKPQKSGSEILKLELEQIVKESIWQLHNTYIFVQIDSGVAIIDQHVAHERILYEKTLAGLTADGKMESQALLFPVKIDLSFEDKYLVNGIRGELEKIGFTISDFGGNTILIEGIPGGAESGDEKKEFLELLDYYKKFHQVKQMNKIDAIAASYSCKKAIKAGKLLTPEEMISLVNDLFLCKFPFVCPHGRPVIINMSLKEINKKFGRS